MAALRRLATVARRNVVTVTGNVYRLATGSATTPDSIGSARVGGTLAGNINVTNTAATDGFSEKLDASISGSTPAVSSAGGSVTGLTAGSINNTGLQVALNTAAAGAISGTATVQLQSDGTGIDGGAAVNSGSPQVVTVTGKVYQQAVASVAPNPVNFGIIHVNQAAVQTLTVSNTASGGPYTDVITGAASVRSPARSQARAHLAAASREAAILGARSRSDSMSARPVPTREQQIWR